MNLCFPVLSKNITKLILQHLQHLFFFSQDDWRLQEEETQETQAPVSCSQVKPKEGKA